MEKFTVDKLRLYRGDDIKINDYVSIHVPTIGEICDYGEGKYYSMVQNLCAVGIDLCWQLEEIGIKFDEISDYDLFVNILCRHYDTEATRIIFGDQLNFKKMVPYLNEKDKSVVLCQTCLESVPLNKSPMLDSDAICQIPINSNVTIIKEPKNRFYKIKYEDFTGYVLEDYIHDNEDGYYISEPDLFNEEDENAEYKIISIDENDYYKIVSCLRSMHNLKRDDRIAGSNSCRMAFIEDAKMEYEARLNEPYKSNLLPMVSTLVNMEGFKRNDTTIWGMNIYAFMDSVKRISKIRNSTLLLQSGYSGFGIDLSKFKNKEELDFMGELN